MRHAERQVVNGAVCPERARVEKDAPRDRDFEEHDALTHAERAHHRSLVAHRRINKARPASLERRERVGPREREHSMGLHCLPPGHFQTVWASPPCTAFSCLNRSWPNKVPNNGPTLLYGSRRYRPKSQ